jgi:excisionase family DNA binding protein
LLSSKAAAERLGVSQNTIRKFVAEGKLPAYYVGDKLVKFDPADLDKYLAAHRVDNS